MTYQSLSTSNVRTLLRRLFTPGKWPCLRALFAALLFAIALPSVAEDFCALKNTNQLVWRDAFQEALKAYFGNARGSFYVPNGSVYTQVRDGLGGPPQDIVPLDGGLALASACRAHSCPEKAAVVIRCPNTIESVGILHFACGTDNRCASQATATLFFKTDTDRTGDADLQRWADANDAKTVERKTRSASKPPPKGRAAGKPGG